MSECGNCGDRGQVKCPHDATDPETGWCAICDHPMDYGTQPGEDVADLWILCPECQ